MPSKGTGMVEEYGSPSWPTTKAMQCKSKVIKTRVHHEAQQDLIWLGEPVPKK
jgi:hypothetical protein